MSTLNLLKEHGGNLTENKCTTCRLEWGDIFQSELTSLLLIYVGGGLVSKPCLTLATPWNIMWNAQLDEAQAEIKTAEGTINNLRYADDTSLMTESKEELKSLLIKVKEESEKSGLKFNIQKTKIMTFSPIPSQQVGGENMKIVTDFSFLGSKITADGDFSYGIERRSLEEKLWQT